LVVQEKEFTPGPGPPCQGSNPNCTLVRDQADCRRPRPIESLVKSLRFTVSALVGDSRT
jgi:hypothetical protein